MGDDNRAAAIVGMEGEGLCCLEGSVEEEVDMVLSVVDKSERGDAAWFETEVFHHAFGRGKGELAT